MIPGTNDPAMVARIRDRERRRWQVLDALNLMGADFDQVCNLTPREQRTAGEQPREARPRVPRESSARGRGERAVTAGPARTLNRPFYPYGRTP